MNSRQTALISETANVTGLLKTISRELALTPAVQLPYEDRRFIVICMTPRSGSSYLGSALKANDIAHTQEHFRIRGGNLERDASKLSEKTYEAYFRMKVESLTSDNGVFAVKCDWPQYAPIYAAGLHYAYLKKAKFFYLTRSDILGQAISRYIATETNYFHSVNENADALNKKVPFSYEGIREHLDYLVKMQSDWERFFACEGISPHRLHYESIAANPARVIRRIGRVMGMKIAEPKTETEYKVVRTEQNVRLRGEFMDEHRQRIESLGWV